MLRQCDQSESMAWHNIRRLEYGQIQRSLQKLWERVEVSLHDCGLDSEKKGMFDVDQNKVMQALPQQINDRYIQLTARRRASHTVKTKGDKTVIFQNLG